MGRLWHQTNPAEMNSNWAPAGDDAAGWVWTYQNYDWKGRPTVTTFPDGSTRENSYGGCGCAGGEVTTVRDERGRRRKLTMDVLGRLKQVDELNWDTSVYSTTAYSYNARDQITQMNQAGQIRTLAYDGHGRLQSRATPEQGTMTYSYFADDATQTVTDARGATTTFAYNNRGLPTSITYGVPGGVAATANVSFAYDAVGNRTSMTDGLGSISYAYNTLSQLTSETRTFTGLGSYALSYAYNLGGELTNITNPWNAQVGYAYDKTGRMTGVTGSGFAGVSSYASSLTYRAFGLKGMSYSNGRQLSINYDNKLRLTRWDVGGVLGSDYEYRWEDTFRPTFAHSRTDATLDRWYNHDQVGRLHIGRSGSEARAAYGEPFNGQYDGPYSTGIYYDVWGNITLKEGWGGENPAYTAGYTNNRRNGFGYDAAGNLTSDGLQTFTYDATGQQTYASATGLTQNYDGDGLRVKKTESGVTNYYLRSSVLGGQVVAEMNSSGTWTRGYVYQGGSLLAVQQSNAVYWMHEDPVTKSKRVTDSSGAVVSTIELDPWGGDTARSNNSAFQPRKYTSYERDANGGDEAMFRRYNRSNSRFDQPDPYDGSYDLADPQSFNRYAYVGNDPVNFVDPTGLQPATCMIDSMPADCSTAGMFLSSGAGVLGPLNTTRWNPNASGGQGQFEFFHVTANSSGWIPRGARYIGGLSWGWTDYSREDAPSYTYSFTAHRLSQLIYWGRTFAFGDLIIRSVYGDVIGERPLEMNPAVDPVWFVAGLAAGGLRAGARAGLPRSIVIKTGHFFTQHFAGTGITQRQLNIALTRAVQSAIRGASQTGSFWGRFTLNGVPIEYHAYTFAGRIYVGSAWPWPK